MAEYNTPVHPMQPYTIRHVDGVMHLSKPQAGEVPDLNHLRFQPPAEPQTEI
jgi:hypothetical protein